MLVPETLLDIVRSIENEKVSTGHHPVLATFTEIMRRTNCTLSDIVGAARVLARQEKVHIGTTVNDTYIKTEWEKVHYTRLY